MKKQKLLCNIRKEDRSNGGATPNYLHLHVTKKQATVEDRMINSNNNILYSKSYLNICIKHKCVFMNFKLVPQEMGSFNILARALNNFKLKYFTHFHSHILHIIQ